jgi:hypothetical protein
MDYKTIQEKIMRDKTFQSYLIELLRYMTSRVLAEIEVDGKNFNEDVLFFLKGGNCVTMLLDDKVKYERMFFEKGITYPFKSDFDMTLIIDPDKYTDELFLKYFKLMVSIVFESINSIQLIPAEPAYSFFLLNDVYKTSGAIQQDKDKIQKTLDYFVKQEIKKNMEEKLENNNNNNEQNKYNMNKYQKKLNKIVNSYRDNTSEFYINKFIRENPIRKHLQVKSYMLTPFEVSLKSLIDPKEGLFYKAYWEDDTEVDGYSGSDFIMPDYLEEHKLKLKMDQIPFDIEIIPDLIYVKDKVAQPIGMTLIKIKTRTSPSIDLIDIAMPRKGVYELYNLEWDLAKDHLIKKDGIMMQDLLYALYDQRIASLLNTREEKVKSRKERIEEIYKFMGPDKDKYMEEDEKIRAIIGKYYPKEGGYRPTAKNVKYLKKWKRGESIGFTMRSSLKAKGLIPRSNGTYRVSDKYKKRVTRKK